MHVLEDSALFASLDESIKENTSGRRLRRTMVKNSFLAFICFIFITALCCLHGMVSNLAHEKDGIINVPGARLGSGAGVADVSKSVLIEFKVANLDGNPAEKGTFVLKTQPSWSKLGAQRVVDLTNDDFWKGCRYFRVLNNFMAQFGIHGDPAMNKKWDKNIADEGVMMSNKRGTVSFAMAGPGTRTTQLFINFKDNKFLDAQGFAPIGRIIEGMDVVDRLYNGYGEGRPQGNGPAQGKIEKQGNKYLKDNFPKLSYIVSANVK
jgi:cyclophilin family peptidyl-prolyl cis-trans isomerase